MSQIVFFRTVFVVFMLFTNLFVSSSDTHLCIFSISITESRSSNLFVRDSSTFFRTLVAHCVRHLLARLTLLTLVKNKKDQEEPQQKPQPTPDTRRKGKSDTDQRVHSQQTNARQAQIPAPSSTNKVSKMLKGQKKHIDKEQGKTKHKTSGSANHRATHNKKTSRPPP